MNFTPEQLRDLALYNSLMAMHAQILAAENHKAKEELSERLEKVEGFVKCLTDQLATQAKDARMPTPAPVPSTAVRVTAVNDGSQAEGSTPE